MVYSWPIQGSQQLIYFALFDHIYDLIDGQYAQSKWHSVSKDSWIWYDQGHLIFVIASHPFNLRPYDNVKLHTYIAPLEACGCFICRILYITSLAGLLQPTLVWRFQEATYIPMQGGALTCLPCNTMALPVLIYIWVGQSLVNLKQGSAKPKLHQCWLWSVLNLQPLTHEPRTIPLHHQG